MKNASQTFYLFRHGIATKSTTGYGNQIVTAQILPEAIIPTEKIAQILVEKDIDYFVSSTFLRCVQTTEIIEKITKKPFVFDKRLNEYYNESFQDLVNRIKSFLKEIKTKPYTKIAICTHGVVIAGIKNLLKTGNFTENESLDYPETGEIEIIKI